MSWAAVAAGTVAATGAIIKGVKARKQRKAAEKIKTVRPIMERTNASKELEGMSRMAANSTRLPGQSYAENQIGAQTARTNAAITQTGGSTAEIISGLTASDDNARRATNDLSFQGAQLNQQNKQMFGNVLNNVSQDQKEMFDYNSNEPFQTDSLKKQSLLDASARNTDNAISTAMDGVNNIVTATGYNKANKLQNTGDAFIEEPAMASAKRKRNIL
jgi:hypothetical protein